MFSASWELRPSDPLTGGSVQTPVTFRLCLKVWIF